MDDLHAGCQPEPPPRPKLQASFASTIAKSCGAAPPGAADLLVSKGLGAAGLAGTCARLGVPSLTSVTDLGACLERHLACRADPMLERTTPRLEELLGLGGVALGTGSTTAASPSTARVKENVAGPRPLS